MLTYFDFLSIKINSGREIVNKLSAKNKFQLKFISFGYFNIMI